jgi:hypothetical protein
MATAPKKSGGGNALTKKAGPLPRWGWVAVGGGAYLVYRFVKARSAAASSTAASGTTGGTTTTGGAGTFSSIADWTQAALDFGASNGLDPGDAFNQIQAYLNGNCVTQAGYNFLSAAFANTSIGLPPAAFDTAQLPTLSVCPGATTTTPPTTPPPSTTDDSGLLPAAPAGQQWIFANIDGSPGGGNWLLAPIQNLAGTLVLPNGVKAAPGWKWVWTGTNWVQLKANGPVGAMTPADQAA